MFEFVTVAYAQGSPGVAEAVAFVDKVNQIILFPFFALLFAVALLVFLWGCFEYIKNSAESSGREEGRKHIMWGIIGMLVMLCAFAILSIITATFGLDDELRCADNPYLTGCGGTVIELDALYDSGDLLP